MEFWNKFNAALKQKGFNDVKVYNQIRKLQDVVGEDVPIERLTAVSDELLSAMIGSREEKQQKLDVVLSVAKELQTAQDDDRTNTSVSDRERAENAGRAGLATVVARLSEAGRTTAAKMDLKDTGDLRALSGHSSAELRKEGFDEADAKVLHGFRELSQLFSPEITSTLIGMDVQDRQALLTLTPQNFKDGLTRAGMEEVVIERELSGFSRLRETLSASTEALTRIEIDLGSVAAFSDDQQQILRRSGIATLEDWLERREDETTSDAMRELLDKTARLHLIGADATLGRQLVDKGVESAYDLMQLSDTERNRLASEVGASQQQMAQMTATASTQAIRAVNYGQFLKFHGLGEVLTEGITDLVKLRRLPCLPCHPELSVFSRYAYFLYLLTRTGESIVALNASLKLDLGNVGPGGEPRPDPELACATITELDFAIRELQKHIEKKRNQATMLADRAAASFLSYESWRAEEMGRYYPELSALWRNDILTGESGPWDRGSILRNHTATRERLREELKQAESVLENAQLAVANQTRPMSGTALAKTSYIHTIRRGFLIIHQTLRADEAIQEALAFLDDDQPGLARGRLNEALHLLEAVATATFERTSPWRDGSADYEFLLSLPPALRWEHLDRLYNELMHLRKPIFMAAPSDIQAAFANFPDLAGWTGSDRYRKARPGDVAHLRVVPASDEVVIKPADLAGNFDTMDRKTFSSGQILTDVTTEVIVTILESRRTSLNAWSKGEIAGIMARVQSDGGGYRLVIRSQIETTQSGGNRPNEYLSLEKTTSATAAPTILAQAPIWMEEGARYRLKLTVDGSTIKGEGTKIGQNTQPIVLEATDNQYPSGSIGFVASRTVGALYGPLDVQVKAVAGQNKGEPFYAPERRSSGLTWSSVYSTRVEALDGMASEPPTALTAVASTTHNVALGRTGENLYVENGQVVVDLKRLDELLDFALAMTFYLRFAALPTRLADALQQSGDYSGAAHMLHLLYDETAPTPIGRNIYALFSYSTQFVTSLSESPDSSLFKLRLGEAYLAHGEFLFKQDTSASRYEAKRLLQRVLALHGGDCACESSVTQVVEQLWQSDTPRLDPLDTHEDKVDLVEEMQNGRAFIPEDVLDRLLGPRGVESDPATVAEGIRNAAETIRDQSRQINTTIKEMVRFDKLQSVAMQVMAELELQAGAVQLQPVPDARSGQWLSNQNAEYGEIRSFGVTNKLVSGRPNIQFLASGLGGTNAPEMIPYMVQSLTMCVPPNPNASAQKQHACLLLDLMRTCHNILGFREDYWPAMRFDAAMGYAVSFADSAREAERDLLSYRQAFETESYSLLQAESQLALNRAEIDLEQTSLQMARQEGRRAALQLAQAEHAANHYRNLVSQGLTEMERLALNSAWATAWLSGIGALGGMLSAASAAVGGATSLSGNPVSVAIGIAGVAGTLLGGAGQVAGFTSSLSSAASTQAGFERREEEWKFTLAQNQANREAAAVGLQLAVLNETYAQRRLDLALLRRDLAIDAVRFLDGKFLNKAMYSWMVRTIREQYKRRLDYAITAAFMAERALAFELQDPAMRIVRLDYFDPRRDGLLGATQLQTDLSELQSRRLFHMQRRLQLTKTISLAAEMPVALAAFRQRGRVFFSLPLEYFDYDFPGHYLRQIKSMKVTVIALIPPHQGIRATLSNNGTSSVVVGPPYTPDFEPRQIRRPRESVALSAPYQASGLFTLTHEDPLLLPFEGHGVETGWYFEMPKAANAFDFDTIADIQFTIEYTALSSDDLRSSVIHELSSRRMLERVFSLRQHFPDEWYDLHNRERVETSKHMMARLETRRSDFAPNIERLETVHIGLFVVRREGSNAELAVRHLAFADVSGSNLTASADPGSQVAQTQQGILSTRAENAPQSWKTTLTGRNRSPVGTWSLAFGLDNATLTQFQNNEFQDILFVITYSGLAPHWPG